MGISDKFDLFILGLVLIPVLVDLIKPLKNKLKVYSQSGYFSAIPSALGAGLIFVHEFSNPIVNLICLVAGFILFFTNYAVSLSALKPYNFKIKDEI